MSASASNPCRPCSGSRWNNTQSPFPSLHENGRDGYCGLTIPRKHPSRPFSVHMGQFPESPVPRPCPAARTGFRDTAPLPAQTATSIFLRRGYFHFTLGAAVFTWGVNFPTWGARPFTPHAGFPSPPAAPSTPHTGCRTRGLAVPNLHRDSQGKEQRRFAEASQNVAGALRRTATPPPNSEKGVKRSFTRTVFPRLYLNFGAGGQLI